MPSDPDAPVTVMDVLYGLYTLLQLPISQYEYEHEAEESRDEIDDAYFARCERMVDPEAVAAEVAKGVRRVDFLKGKNTFKGLSGTYVGPHIWELNVA